MAGRSPGCCLCRCWFKARCSPPARWVSAQLNATLDRPARRVYGPMCEGLGSQDCYAGGVIVSLYLLNRVGASATPKENVLFPVEAVTLVWEISCIYCNALLTADIQPLS